MNFKTKPENLFKLCVLLVFVIYLFLAKIFYLNLFSSAFKYYSFINGLDMQTLLKWGVNSMNRIESANNLYVYVISLIAGLTNGSLDTVNYIVILQLFFGLCIVAMSMAIAYIFYNSKSCSIIAGFLTALYAPLLMYDGFVLKTSLCVLLFSLTLLFTSLLIKKTHPIYGLFLGIAVGAFLNTFFGSFSLSVMLFLLILYYIYKKKFKKKVLTSYIGGVIVFFAIFYAFNLSSIPLSYALKNSKWFEYVYSVGNQKNIENLNAPVYQETDKTIFNNVPHPVAYIKKIVMLLSFNEIPDNINYYFVREGIFPLKYMLSPFLLFILAIPSFILCCLFVERRHLLIICLFLVFMSLPLVAFVPLSRYTVIFAPLGCIITSFGLKTLFDTLKTVNLKIFLLIAIMVIVNFLLQWEHSYSPFFRSTDFTTYATALSIQNPDDSRILYAYKNAYLLNKESIQTGMIYCQLLMDKGEYKEALIIINKLITLYPNNNNLNLLLSSALLANNQVREARKVLESIDPTKINNRDQYFYNLGTILFLNKEYPKSLDAYTQINLLMIPIQISEDIKAKIMQCKSQINDKH